MWSRIAKARFLREIRLRHVNGGLSRAGVSRSGTARQVTRAGTSIRAFEPMRGRIRDRMVVEMASPPHRHLDQNRERNEPARLIVPSCPR